MKNIILCGGTGSRLGLVTKGINKQLLPLYNGKPIISNSIELFKHLSKNKTTDILFVTNSKNVQNFSAVFHDEEFNYLNPYFACQKEALGIPDAIKYGKGYSNAGPVTVMLGDTIFDRHVHDQIKSQINKIDFNNDFGCYAWYTYTESPKEYGVLSYGKNHKVINIIEKSQYPTSNDAVVGFYIFDYRVWNIIDQLKKSPRGEYEVVDILKYYLNRNELHLNKLAGTWFDLGQSMESYLESIINESLK